MIKILLPLFPAFAAFGPVMMVMGARSAGTPWVAYFGALMCSIALMTLLMLFAQLAKEQQKGSSGPTTGSQG